MKSKPPQWESWPARPSKLSRIERQLAQPRLAWPWLLLMAAGCLPANTREITFGSPPGLVAGQGAVPGVASTAGVAAPAAVGGAAGVAGVAAVAAAAAPPTPVVAGSAAPASMAGAPAVALPDTGLPAFDGGVAANRNQVQAGGLCQRLVTLQCAAEVHCCANPGRTSDACRSDFMTTCSNTAQLDTIAKNPITGFNAQLAESAFTKYEQLASQCDPGLFGWALKADGLRGIVQGTREPQQDCRPTGLPSVAGYGAALASCKQPGAYACLFTGNGPIAAPSSASCAPRGGSAAPCYLDTNCIDGLFCDNPSMVYSGGACTLQKPLGSACTLDGECSSLFCRGSACVPPSAQTAYCPVK